MRNERSRRFLAGIICVMLMGCAGCKQDEAPDPTKETQKPQESSKPQETQLSEEAQRIEDAIDEHYNDGFQKVELRYSFLNNQENIYSEQGESISYGREKIYIGQLITDEHVQSIEWMLENCVGSFMDKSDALPVIMIPKIKSKPFLLEGNNQEDVFFTVYFYCDDALDGYAQTRQIQNCIKYLRITADITFEDGTKETRKYGVRYTTETATDVRYMRLHLLE